MSVGDKYKILCLHGLGTNSDILETQTASLRYRLRESHTFSFLDGGHPWPPAPGIEASFGQSQAKSCLSYYDGTASSAAEAVRDLASYLCENGPFHHVLGFSLGASLIATLLMCPNTEANFEQAKSMIRTAIFICGILPQEWCSLRDGTFKETRADDMDEEKKIDIETIHAYSMDDAEFRGQNEGLLELCKASTRTKFLHTAGHDIPRSPGEVEILARAIIAQATVLQ
ncbi:hypothetical protein Daus18300_012577 [Diaporthe australafricana]|uniref:Serine hydrolase domain-containing protein n=1 Tax=Diaporthe australafricana TaxID=127596 RepID=A0ABR3W2C1_9PEZI